MADRWKVIQSVSLLAALLGAFCGVSKYFKIPKKAAKKPAADVDVSVEVAPAPEPEPAAAEKTTTPAEDAMAAKRAEIMAKVAAAQEAQAKAARSEETLDASKFGTHKSITCDGCSTVPIVGYRWRCRSCKNHDLCDICYESFKNGKLPQSVDQQRCNPVSPRVEDHEFFAFAEQGSFSGMKGASGAPKSKAKKTKPNDPCPCGSGKKCADLNASHSQPQPDPTRRAPPLGTG